MRKDPEIKWAQASETHEEFYQGLVALSVKLQLRDEEVAALTGKMLGYNRALQPEASSSVPHLTDVFRQNMRRGFQQMQTGEPLKP